MTGVQTCALPISRSQSGSSSCSLSLRCISVSFCLYFTTDAVRNQSPRTGLQPADDKPPRRSHSPGRFVPYKGICCLCYGTFFLEIDILCPLYSHTERIIRQPSSSAECAFFPDPMVLCFLCLCLYYTPTLRTKGINLWLILPESGQFLSCFCLFRQDSRQKVPLSRISDTKFTHS